MTLQLNHSLCTVSALTIYHCFFLVAVRVTFQGKGQRSFEEVWPDMRLIVLKLLKQETVSQVEWQDLFYGVHLVCLWDEKGAAKIYDCLRNDVVEFIAHAQLKVQSQRGEHALLTTYIIEWRKFFTQSSYLPLPFRQLEHWFQSKAPSSSSSSSCSASTSTANQGDSSSSLSTSKWYYWVILYICFIILWAEKYFPACVVKCLSIIIFEIS